jgi:hypothetical protein
MDELKRVLKRIGIILLVCLAMVIVGTMIGYGIGGGNPFAVFLPHTWSHILDFMR